MLRLSSESDAGQVIRDMKYNTTGRSVIKGIQGQNQNQKSEKTYKGLAEIGVVNKGVSYAISH